MDQTAVPAVGASILMTFSQAKYSFSLTPFSSWRRSHASSALFRAARHVVNTNFRNFACYSGTSVTLNHFPSDVLPAWCYAWQLELRRSTQRALSFAFPGTPFVAFYYKNTFFSFSSSYQSINVRIFFVSFYNDIAGQLLIDTANTLRPSARTIIRLELCNQLYLICDAWNLENVCTISLIPV